MIQTKLGGSLPTELRMISLNSQLEAEVESCGKSWGEAKYYVLDENQIALVAFGLFPKEVIDEGEDYFRDAVARRITARLAPDKLNVEIMKSCVHQFLVNAFSKGTVLGLMESAKECDKMIA